MAREEGREEFERRTAQLQRFPWHTLACTFVISKPTRKCSSMDDAQAGRQTTPEMLSPGPAEVQSEPAPGYELCSDASPQSEREIEHQTSIVLQLADGSDSV